MRLAEYIDKLEQGLRELAEQERAAQEKAARLREAVLRQEGALLALRELMLLTDQEGAEDGALHRESE